MVATSVDAVPAVDGLIRPEEIPGGLLNPSKVSDACVQARYVARQIRFTVSEVSTSFGGVRDSFEMPGAEPIYGAMTAPGTSLSTFAGTLESMSRALDDFATAVDPLKTKFEDIRTRARAFIDTMEIGNRVWMPANQTREYQGNGLVTAHSTTGYGGSTGSYSYSTGTSYQPYGASSQGANPAATQSQWYSVYDATSYLRGRGETTRVINGHAEILVTWLESGEHVNKNNDLMDEIADTFAKLSEAEADCANRINALRETACVAEVVPVEAWTLKQEGVETPWGSRVDEQRNCGEQVGHGFYTFGVETARGFGSMIGYNYMSGEWGDWEHAGETWTGIGNTVKDLAVMTSLPLMLTVGMTEGWDSVADSGEGVLELGKGLVSWDTWEDDPAQALTETILNVGTAFIPVAGWAGAGVKGLSKVAGLTRITSMLTKLDELGVTVKTSIGLHPKLDFDGAGSKFELNAGAGARGLDDLADGARDIDLPDHPTTGHVDGVDSGTHAGPDADHTPTPKHDTGSGSDHHGATKDADDGSPAPKNDGDGDSGTTPKDDGDANSEHGSTDTDSVNGDDVGHGGDHDGADSPHDSNGTPASEGGAENAIAKSELSAEQLDSYLESTKPELYKAYLETGHWPEDVQIPRDSSVLNVDGSIDWDQVPKGGYELDAEGNAIKGPYAPEVGEVIDRYGPAEGRYTSPVPDSGPYQYGERSLPYVEDPAQYHRYSVEADFGHLKDLYDQSPPATQLRVDAYMQKWELDWDDLHVQKGNISSGFGEPGGGVQLELPLPLKYLIDMGALKEI